MSTGRITGIILIILAIVVLVAGGGLLLAQRITEENATTGGQLLGFVACVLPVALALGAGGVFLVFFGRREEAQMTEARAEQKILSMVLAQGKVRLDEVAIELNRNRDQVQDWFGIW